MYARFIAGMPAFLSQRITRESARATVSARLAARESNFLRLFDGAVVSKPQSPYNFLMREAGVEPGDVRRLVGQDGLDAALGKLFDAGVSVTFDEFKGRKPIVRGAHALDTTAASFDSPLINRQMDSMSSGTTGAPTTVRSNLAHVSSLLPMHLLAQEAAGLAGAPMILYRPGLPCTVAINTALRQIVVGNPVRRWFSPVNARETNSPMRFRVAGALTPGLVRALRKPFPPQEFVPFPEAVVVAQAAGDLAAREGRCHVRCTVSAALTVANAAVANGIDLTGVAFVGAGEPPSPAKVRGIQASGARYVTSYAMTESGKLGVACFNAVDPTDVHFLRDKMAVVQRTQIVPVLEQEVGVFHFTTLLPTAPKIMINVASDDFGVLEERQCGCALGELGFHQHLRQIRSVGKVTGRGITLVSSDVEHIIEDVLPTRFGGTSQDYQLVEEETDSGETQLHLLVSPSVKLDDEAEPARVFVEALSHGTPGAALQSAIMKSANAVRVRRLKPRLTTNGKLPVFRTTVAR
jgi:hypothetical protein